LAALLLAPAAARGAGPPPSGASAKTGVVGLGGGTRWVARPARGGTVVRQLVGGRVVLSRFLPQRLVVPAVALDGSASGLSADGRTLVLTRPRSDFPAPRTDFTVLDARTLEVRDRIALQGEFRFDAISPDGATLYLVNYASQDPSNYAVRAYSVPAHRLDPKPVIDPHEPDEQMRGLPLTRVTSRDGSWAYTLYDGFGKTPFVHALDTSHRTARCIDLPQLAAVTDIGKRNMHLSADGRRLSIVDSGTTSAVIDLRTFRLAGSPAPVAARRPAAATPDKGGGSSAPWGLIGGLGLACLLAGVAVVVATRRGRGPGATEVSPD
jgi:hypothetical protein